MRRPGPGHCHTTGAGGKRRQYRNQRARKQTPAPTHPLVLNCAPATPRPFNQLRKRLAYVTLPPHQPGYWRRRPFRCGNTGKGWHGRTNRN